jgi:hypothetical protein
MFQTKATNCGYLIPKKGPCTVSTKHSSGRCHWHRGLNGPSAADALIEDDEAAAVLTADPMPTTADDPTSGIAPLPPEGPAAGDPVGVAVLVADGDITDSTIIAQRYLTGGGKTRDVLHLHLTTEGEKKLVDSLSMGGYTTVTTQVEEMQSGVHPLDDGSFSQQAETLARSMNARMKNGTDRLKDGANVTAFAELKAKHAMLAHNVSSDDTAGQAMLAHYQAQLDTLEPYTHADATIAPYNAGGKIPLLQRWEGEFAVMVEKHEQIPIADVTQFSVPTAEVPGRRIHPQQKNGEAHWSGEQMMTAADAPKSMWEMDLGEGYKALYYPRSATEKAAKGGGGAHHEAYAGASTRGRMSVIAPPGGNAAEALRRMERLHLSTRPMQQAEAEYTFLERNIYAHELHKNPVVAEARHRAAMFPQQLAKARISARASEAAAFADDPVKMAEWVRAQRVAAESESLPARAKLLREATAKALGFSDGAAMQAHPSYKPQPIVGKSGISFRRIAQGPAGHAHFPATTISHRCNRDPAEAMRSMARTGVLASQERRKLMGIRKVFGISQKQDVGTRGASTVFTSPSNGGPSTSSHTLSWSGEQAKDLSSRTDWYWTGGDAYGAQQNAKTKTSDVGHGGQLMFNGQIDIDAHPPTRWNAGSVAFAQELHGLFAARGVTVFGDGRKVTDVIVP